MVNISSIKAKSNGIIRQIFNRLESLNLMRYYFECAMVLMNSMLRSSILYAAETYYDLKEKELREIERIEETFMKGPRLRPAAAIVTAVLLLSVKYRLPPELTDIVFGLAWDGRRCLGANYRTG